MFEVGLAEKAAQAHALLADLAAAVDSQTSGPEAVEALTEVLAAVRQGELATCRLIERVDRSVEYAYDGAASTTSYVRGVCRERGSWVSRRLQLGRALADRLPSTGKAWAAGDCGLEHAEVIMRATASVDDRQLAGEVEVFLAGQAPGLTPTELRVVADELLAQLAPEESAADTARKRAAQHLHVSKTLDGMSRLDGWLDAEAGLIVANAIEAFTRKPDPDGDLLTESAGRRRADALVQLCRHAMTHAASCNGQGGSRHTIVVGLSAYALRDGLGTAGIDGGGTLPAAAVRRMACDAGIIPALYGSDSEIVDFGRRARTPPAGLRAKLVARDGGCTFPGCDRPPSWTEAHHRRHWTAGGITEEDNLHLLCCHHHHLVHEGGWRITVSPPTEHHQQRSVWFHPPDGRPPLRGQRRPLIRRM
jgi:hypothetical protein